MIGAMGKVGVVKDGRLAGWLSLKRRLTGRCWDLQEKG